MRRRGPLFTRGPHPSLQVRRWLSRRHRAPSARTPTPGRVFFCPVTSALPFRHRVARTPTAHGGARCADAVPGVEHGDTREPAAGLGRYGVVCRLRRVPIPARFVTSSYDLRGADARLEFAGHDAPRASPRFSPSRLVVLEAHVTPRLQQAATRGAGAEAAPTSPDAKTSRRAGAADSRRGAPRHGSPRCSGPRHVRAASDDVRPTRSGSPRNR
jgi:hypothetical protein